VADADQVRAFVLEPLSAVVLHRGTWHWGPFPVAADSVSLFNVQGRRYLEDNDSVDLEGLGTPLDVLLG
jgi:ureidoglycolate hydrolase